MKLYRDPVIFDSVVILLFAGLLTSILHDKLENCRNCFKKRNTGFIKSTTELRPGTKKFACAYHGDNEVNVFSILEKLGYENDPFTTEWDLLWGGSYLYWSINNQLTNAKPYQLVNQYWSTGYVTRKYRLNCVVNRNEPFAMPCFELPREHERFREFTEKNPGALFVTKSFNHRGIRLINSTANFNQSKYFLQRFMKNPLLIGGHKFEMGIYTIITSKRPLRVYIYNGEIALRFCPSPYHPFDPNNLDKYVVADSYMPIWEVPELGAYYNAGYGMRSSLKAYLKTRGIDAESIFSQAVNIIVKSLLNSESYREDEPFPNKKNFFELIRFDFLVDDTVTVYLLEANFMPNLYHDYQPKNRLLFEQLLYNVFSLVGAAPRIKKNTLAMSYDEALMEANDRNTAVYLDSCREHCVGSCKKKICKFCHTCMTRDDKNVLLKAYTEHVNRMDCKRVIPPQMHKDFVIPKKLTAKDHWMYGWFLGKCLQDETWCI